MLDAGKAGRDPPEGCPLTWIWWVVRTLLRYGSVSFAWGTLSAREV